MLKKLLQFLKNTASKRSGGRDDAKVLIPATVVLRNMFAPAEMRSDENLSSELEADIQEECVKLGPVDSVKMNLMNDKPRLTSTSNQDIPVGSGQRNHNLIQGGRGWGQIWRNNF
ncbi:hypothetical protein Acr_24g0005210 [Actinidia rufa]|uniref:Uncharacterized protein n=1 Tax=Actinidia rufa TaxID=165716 RepID=A0A7J0GUC1_9ERIC|nr:hypothetical protein Acr_24g0005210 [Actinidia rufa]